MSKSQGWLFSRVAVPGTKFPALPLFPITNLGTIMDINLKVLSEMLYLPAYLVSWLSVLMNEDKNPNFEQVSILISDMILLLAFSAVIHPYLKLVGILLLLYSYLHVRVLMKQDRTVC